MLEVRGDERLSRKSREQPRRRTQRFFDRDDATASAIARAQYAAKSAAAKLVEDVVVLAIDDRQINGAPRLVIGLGIRGRNRRCMRVVDSRRNGRRKSGVPRR